MKFVTIILAVVFNLTLLLMYSRGLVGAGRTGENGAPESRPGARVRVAERSASAPIERGSRSATAKAGDAREGKEVAEPVRDGGEGKETIDPKGATDLLEPVADEPGRVLRLRGGPGQPSTEIMPGAARVQPAPERRVLGPAPRGILAPANPANVDPPVVSPEAP